ncbi:MAG: hypothetical protein CMJ34_01635 [Phycisphaerae bacterium]|nr:hypothetical protein [Phycisphaerae bacterium]
MTRRARRRILLLLVFLVGLSGLVTAAWFLRSSQKVSEARLMRVSGMEDAEAGNWSSALRKLSKAVAYDKEDLEALIVLADARSRVPEVNNRHFVTAMSLYSRASDIARATDAPMETRMRALSGRGRMELASGAIANLRDTAIEILEIDPDDIDAIGYLYEISKLEGKILPSGVDGIDEVDLIVRGDRSDESWLDEMRRVGDDSALRWSLEMVASDPDDLTYRDQVLVILREGGTTDIQRLRRAQVIESTEDLVEQWSNDGTISPNLASILVATEAMRDRNIEAAREAVAEADERGLERPELILRAINVLEATGSGEDKELSNELLARVQKAAMETPEIAIQVASRYWYANQGRRALGMIDAAVEAAEGEERSDLYITGVLLASLIDSPDLVERIDLANDFIDRGDVTPERRDGHRRFIDLAMIKNKDNMKSNDVVEAFTLAAGFPKNVFVQVLFGDILANAGLQVLSNEAWKRACQLSGYRSMPVGQRLVRGHLDAQAVDKAFEEAANLASASPNVVSVMLLCETWLALESVGIDPKDVVPQFDARETPLAMLEGVRRVLLNAGGDDAIIIPILAQAALREERLDLVSELMESACENGDSASMLLQLLGISNSNDDLDYGWRLLERTRSLADLDVSSERMAVIESTMLRADGRPEEALALIDAVIAARQESTPGELLGLERLENLRAMGVGVEELIVVLESLLELPLSNQQLERLHGIILRLDDDEEGIARMISQRYVDRSVELFGRDSYPFAQAVSQHVLRFEREDPESVLDAILVADPHVSSRKASIGLQLSLVSLLEAASPPQTGRAIEVLRDVMTERPGRFDVSVRLVDLLQKDGRYEEAGEQIQRLSRRRDAAPPELQALIPSLIVGQGDVDLVASSLCEHADRTGRPLDRLECVRALYAAGDGETADEYLEQLRADPDRPAAVDLEVAARMAAGGDQEGALAVLLGSDRFMNEISRDLAVGGMLLQLGRWDELKALLDRWGDADGEVDSNRLSDMEILRAMYLIRGPAKDPSSAGMALETAVSLAPEREAILVRNATIRLENNVLRPTVREAIELLKPVAPGRARVMELALEASPDGKSFSGSPELVAKARELVSMYPRSRPAHTLALEILNADYAESMEGNDFPRITRSYENLVDFTIATVEQFPGDQEIPVLLSNVYMGGGEFERALEAAREGRRRAGRGEKFENVLPVIMIEARMGRYGDAVRNITPYREEIETAVRNLGPPPGNLPPLEQMSPEMRRMVSDRRTKLQRWSLLINCLLGNGEVDEAWNVFSGRPSMDPGASRAFLSGIETAPPEAAVQAGLRMREVIPPGPPRLRLIGALLAAHRESPTRSLRALIEEEIDLLVEATPGPAASMQAELLRVGLEDTNDSIGAADGFLAILDGLPPGTIRDAKRRLDLEGDRRRSIDAIYNAIVMTMNNAAAMGAKAFENGQVAPVRSGDLIDRLNRIADDLGQLQPGLPEILDTRAMVAIASGDGPKALALAEGAVREQPLRSSFRFTMARALLLEGRAAEARSEVMQAMRLLRREGGSESGEMADMQAFLAETRNAA